MAEGLEQEAQRSSPAFLAADLLPALAAAAIFPFDAVLAGMVGAGQCLQAICLYLGVSCAALDDHLIRLNLARPHDRPLRRGGRNSWTPEDIARLIAWRVARVHPESIGVRLGRTSGAVRSKSRRLGLPKPARKALRKADPLSLQDPPPGFGFVCRNSAGCCVPLRPRCRCPYFARGEVCDDC